MRKSVLGNRGPRAGSLIGRGFVAAGVVMVMVACDGSPSEPAEEVYSLATVNGEPLPGPFPDPQMPINAFEVTAGTLTLYPNGRLAQTLTMRCKTPLPHGTDCHVEGDGRTSSEGRYFRAEGRVEFGGTRYQATFEADRVTITVAYPPSQGYSPQFTLDYRR